jgi:LAO/AO transport system kinase
MTQRRRSSARCPRPALSVVACGAVTQGPAHFDDLTKRVCAGEVRAIARAMRLIDDRAEGYSELLKALFPHTGRAYVLGVTGTPGAGKSTLVDRLIAVNRVRGKRVGVVAVDPTSPFSGGAILGDRIRMQKHFLDDGVFIRSLATRGHLGGLSRSAADVIRVLDAAGFDLVIVETVGVGQDELDVARLAHTTLVIVPPGMGDDIQAIKAGILEIASVFVVNKADRDGADATVRDLEQMLALGDQLVEAAAKSPGHSASMMRAIRGADAGQAPGGPWHVPVLRTVATRNEGLHELMAAVDAHRAHLEGTEDGRAQGERRLLLEFDGILRETLVVAAERRWGESLAKTRADVGQKRVDPYSASEALVNSVVDRAVNGDVGA